MVWEPAGPIMEVITAVPKVNVYWEMFYKAAEDWEEQESDS